MGIEIYNYTFMILLIIEKSIAVTVIKPTIELKINLSLLQKINRG